MSFLCPQCKKYTLEIKKTIEAVPGPMDDEKAIQLIACPCGFEGAAVYEESRRGAEPVFNHDGYVIPAELMSGFKENMADEKETEADDFIINKQTKQKFNHFSMDLLG